ncbi:MULTISPECIES: hypothetical protein [unclassified Rhodococcus (in: high G+C Gram-positive bacteria)]|uniref:hypothetical protein n=1 Tax=unclassified Rhodococcus (in: high G+C Gram-positive bacteria) TaxID=192944 RepID=UPI00163A2F7D|nr:MULTISPECIES: hypothetical protein [unclassified Rhodococcus (in: high G+C Gram-positive bacteria)]MBC2637872.1 hypothetical protein [Rhodococcus sp. 3A]MBC2897380.1 hypothetical protein [Rhodococcus sp. 4CII]
MPARRTIALSSVAVIGAVLFLFPLVTGMLSKAQSVDTLTGDLRANFEPDALAQTRADMNTVQAMSDQLQTETLPALPNALGMPPEQFQSFVGENFPDVASGIGQLDTILPKFQGLVTGLETQAPNFRSADQIPTGFLPSTTVPYLFLVPGAVLFVLAGAALVLGRDRTRSGMSRIALLVSIVIGLVFVVAPLILSVPVKTKAVDDLTAAFGPIFTEEGVAAVRSDMDVIQKMSDQLQAETAPALAEALKMDPTQFQSFMGQNFPDVAAGMGQLNDILPRFQALVAGMERNVESFQQAASIPTATQPTTTLTWWLIIPGVALIVLGGIGIPASPPTEGRLTPRERTLQGV